MPQPVVCLLDPYPPTGPYDRERDIFAERGIELRLADCQRPDDVAEQGRGAEVLLTMAVAVTGAALEALPDCRLVVRWGVGYDSIDVAAATRLGIAVGNCPTYCTEEVADHAAALILAGVRKLALVDRLVRAGEWPVQAYRPIQRLRGQTLGFVGFGRIARATAHKLSGFAFRALAYDPYLPAEVVRQGGAEPVTLADLCAQADIISVHVPLGPSTRHLIGAAELGRLRPSALLVNTSRGPIIDEAALAEALTAGKLAGAALDVFEEEPLPAASPLRQMPNVTLSPHMAAYSEASLVDIRREVCQNAIDWLEQGWMANVVNPEVRERLRPRAR